MIMFCDRCGCEMQFFFSLLLDVTTETPVRNYVVKYILN